MSQTWGSYASLINVNELSEYVRHAALDMLGFAQLCNAPTGGALGRERGDTVQYTYYPDVTTAGGELSETDEVPTTSITPIKGTYTIAEFGNAIELTEKLQDLSRLDAESDLIQAMVRDMKRLENGQAYDAFSETHWLATFNATADEFVTNNTLTSVANQQLDLENLRFLVRQAEKRLIPFFDGESYAVVTGVDSADALCYDSTVTNLLKEDSGRAALNGEVGRIGKSRIIRDTQKVAKVGGGATGAGALLDETFLIGADAVVHEVATPWEMRAEDRDLGRKVKLGYLGKMAWVKMLSQTLHSKEHVIKVDSAA